MIAEIVRIAEEAGRRISAIYESQQIDVVKKPDDSPLTSADIAAQETILAGLRALGDIPVLSEESPVPDFAVRKEWRLLWLVDPLDGTREFISRNGEFTVNIALVEEGRPIMGVVHAPVLSTTYWAQRGCGAFVARAGGELQRIGVREDAGRLTLAASRSHAGEALPRFLERLGSHEVRYMGSSLKVCLVAEGTAQLYPRLGPTFEWDTAAAHCVVAEAGGLMCDFRGEELLYNKEELRNPWCFAAATERERSAALAAFASAYIDGEPPGPQALASRSKH